VDHGLPKGWWRAWQRAEVRAVLQSGRRPTAASWLRGDRILPGRPPRPRLRWSRGVLEQLFFHEQGTPRANPVRQRLALRLHEGRAGGLTQLSAWLVSARHSSDSFRVREKPSGQWGPTSACTARPWLSSSWRRARSLRRSASSATCDRWLVGLQTMSGPHEALGRKKLQPKSTSRAHRVPAVQLP